MEQAIIETIMQIVATLFITLIGVGGAWLTAQIGKNKKLSNIANATEQVIRAAQITVGELKQTVVDDLKKNGAKLSPEQVSILNRKLLEQTYEKLSAPALNLLSSAAVDINALITGAGEDWINSIK
jgi:DNA polymerase III delta subunit